MISRRNRSIQDHIFQPQKRNLRFKRNDRFERNLRKLNVIEWIKKKWSSLIEDYRKYFTKINPTFVNRTNEFSNDLSLETGYRRSRLNIKATRDISRDIFPLYEEKKKKNRGISSSSCSKLNNSFLSCSPSPAWKIHMHGSHRRGSHRATRKQPRRRVTLESWKKSQLKEWFTRVDAARIRVMVRLVTRFQQLTVELFRCSWGKGE